MTDLSTQLADRLAAAFTAVAAASSPSDAAPSTVDPVLRRSEHADFQANGALGLGKRLRRNPREVAVEAVAQADLAGLVSRVEVAGPGFINLTVDDRALNAAVERMAADPRLGVAPADESERVVVDYSGPNVAKEMHIGHLRSTIIGDALVRLLEFLGHEVVRRNHIGDWGTPFGMLIEHLRDTGADAAAHELAVGDMNAFYQEARRKFDADPTFAERAKDRVVRLQAGDLETLRLWEILVTESRRYFRTVYDRLGVRLTPDDDRGESAYNDRLGSVVDELTEKGLAVLDDGALVTFPEGFAGREGKPVPLILRKTDGGFGYDVTDLAALAERALDLGGQRLVYITDLGQRLHFEMVFTTGREAGWLGEKARAEFYGFGVILGTDRRRLRTRAGDNPKLIDLLDEATSRAAQVVAEKAPHLLDAERAEVAEAVGIGAVKYADLSGDRVKDYVFDLDQMVSFDGDTAPYLQYAHARIRSLLTKAGVELEAAPTTGVRIVEPAEHTLALRLGEFEGVLHEAAAEVEIHKIAAYLFGLATAFTTFYEQCPVLRAPDEETRRSRLVLCAVTARVLATGLDLLGIAAPRRM